MKQVINHRGSSASVSAAGNGGMKWARTEEGGGERRKREEVDVRRGRWRREKGEHKEGERDIKN